MARVLVMDDDTMVLDLLGTVLAEEGHTPLAYGSLDQVPSDLDADVVVTDLVPLKAYRSEEARRWISSVRGRFQRTPLIVLTAHAEALDEPDGLGANAVITKPFDVDTLLSKVRELLN